VRIDDVRDQMTSVIGRAIETGMSVQQNFPTETRSAAAQFLGQLPGSSIALRDVDYADIYRELESNNIFHIKLPDGGLLLFQYTFSLQGDLIKHRLCFFPSPVLPTHEEAPDLYRYDELYADILTKQAIRFPIRFDFDPDNYVARYHPHSHLTLGQFQNCRIPVTHAVSPNAFLLFVVRNFYHRLYRSHSNVLNKRLKSCTTPCCITSNEKSIPHFGFIDS